MSVSKLSIQIKVAETSQMKKFWKQSKKVSMTMKKIEISLYQCCNEASKIFVLRRFLAEDPSSSSSSVHFKLSKNLRSFEDFRPKIPKIFGIKSFYVEEVLKEN